MWSTVLKSKIRIVYSVWQQCLSDSHSNTRTWLQPTSGANLARPFCTIACCAGGGQLPLPCSFPWLCHWSLPPTHRTIDHPRRLSNIEYSCDFTIGDRAINAVAASPSLIAASSSPCPSPPPLTKSHSSVLTSITRPLQHDTTASDRHQTAAQYETACSYTRIIKTAEFVFNYHLRHRGFNGRFQGYLLTTLHLHAVWNSLTLSSCNAACSRWTGAGRGSPLSIFLHLATVKIKLIDCSRRHLRAKWHGYDVFLMGRLPILSPNQVKPTVWEHWREHKALSDPASDPWSPSATNGLLKDGTLPHLHSLSGAQTGGKTFF